MSEWIDLCVFALQAVMLWVVFPRWGTPFARHMLEDRNPAWAEAHPQQVERLASGGKLLPMFYAWGVISVALLLVIRLGLQPDFLRPADSTPSWEVLQNASNALIAGGLIVMGIGFAASLRWLKRHVPLAERRHASLAPRTAGQYAPRWALWLAFGISAAHALAWVVVGLSGLPLDEHYWVPAAGMSALTALLYVTFRVGIARRPNHYDRALGPVYRQTEIRVYLAMMLVVSAMGLIGLYREVTGFDTDRAAGLAIAVFITAAIVSFTRLPARTAGGDNGGGVRPASVAARTSAITTLLVPLLLPLTLVTLQPAHDQETGTAPARYSW